MLTRVAGADGRQYAEVRLLVALPEDEPHARLRLATLLTRLPGLIGGGQSGGHPGGRRGGRP
jgi:hypothetical protein